MESECLFGLETEMAFMAIQRANSPPTSVDAAEELLALAYEQLRYLHGKESKGIFLGNGGRLYLDTGHRIEYATPELTKPEEAVQYLNAGNQILADMAAAFRRKRPQFAEASFYRANVDYGRPGGTTWGQHESYLYRSDPQLMPDQIIPHLVSRIVFTGAGGFNAREPDGAFMVSPRVAYLVKDKSSSTTSDRGIYNTKNEPLADHASRLHVISGENVCSEKAQYLKIGTTALVVRMIDLGLCPGDDVLLQDPVGAMRQFSLDTKCRIKVLTAHGCAVSAVEIQRHYLQIAWQNAGHPRMPPWTGQVCQRWEKMLERIEQGAPDSVAEILDWAIKYKLYSRYLERNSLTWQAMSCGCHVHRVLCDAITAKSEKKSYSVEELTSGRTPINAEVEQMGQYLRLRGLDWNDFSRYLNVRDRLYEMDVRFGQLDERGIFNSMDQAGVLDHRVPDTGDAEYAKSYPPAGSRAQWRGEWIQRLAGDLSFRAEWQGIWNIREKQFLNLCNPHQTEPPQWSAVEDAAALERMRADMLRRMEESLRAESNSSSINVPHHSGR